MKNLIKIVAVASTIATASHAQAIVDDGSGCGCIRPCWIINR